MSHFAVLVPAVCRDELEARLLPYHEYECTGIEAYTEWVVEHAADEAEVDARAIVEGLDEGALRDKYEAYLAASDLDAIFGDWNGLERDANGNYGNKTNPNARWDWWVIGGRWSNTLLRKDGFRADTASTSDVDWGAMAGRAATQSGERWDAWKEVKALEADGATKEDVRKALDDADFTLTRNDEVADLDSLTREAYVEKYGQASAITFAFIDLEGNWHERGKMGWWGCFSEREDGYDAEFWAFVRSLSDEQRVYIVDCHI